MRMAEIPVITESVTYLVTQLRSFFRRRFSRQFKFCLLSNIEYISSLCGSTRKISPRRKLFLMLGPAFIKLYELRRVQAEIKRVF